MDTAYTWNGSVVRRQVCGLPMGLPHAPQIVALACFPIERDYALHTRPAGLVCRFIDDIFVSGMSPPSMEAYAMQYRLTSTNPHDIVYLGVRVWERDGQLHTTLYDRGFEYPFLILRYPHWDTVAPRAQLKGVLIGRFVACASACALMTDFKEAVGIIIRHALMRKYPKGILLSAWARFLHTKWQSAVH